MPPQARCDVLRRHGDLLRREGDAVRVEAREVEGVGVHTGLRCVADPRDERDAIRDGDGGAPLVRAVGERLGARDGARRVDPADGGVADGRGRREHDAVFLHRAVEISRERIDELARCRPILVPARGRAARPPAPDDDAAEDDADDDALLEALAEDRPICERLHAESARGTNITAQRVILAAQPNPSVNASAGARPESSLLLRGAP
jgi:hypothetical protein